MEDLNLTPEEIAALGTEEDYRQGQDGLFLIMTPEARKYFIENLGHSMITNHTRTITLEDAEAFVKWYKEEYLPALEKEEFFAQPLDDLLSVEDLKRMICYPWKIKRWVEIDPFVLRNIKNPYISHEVFEFLDQELQKLGLNWNTIWFESNLSMSEARNMINDLRKERGLELI
ncbi:MAG: hypothetical protein Q7K65_04385 [Candidatus Buchananbacteria bacterium]|nr:hypothetical protein [Candidatus Buchananbacteria bacterium]